MDALQLLTADHNRVRGLFKRFSSAEEEDKYEAMAELQQTIFNELEVHTQIEEEVFYPQVKDASEDIGDTVAESFEEHHVVKVLMSEIKELQAKDDVFAAKMKVLIENVEHHAKEEEEELFPDVRKALGAEKLDKMAKSLEELKARLGAPTMADKIDLTTEQLEELAREQEIPGRSKLSKEELAATVAPVS